MEVLVGLLVVVIAGYAIYRGIKAYQDAQK